MLQNNRYQNTRLPKYDIPWLMSKIALQELRRLQPQDSVNNEFWNALRDDRPNLADYLQSASYQIAPDDPELRAEIASFGVNLMYMFSETSGSVVSDPKVEDIVDA